MQNMLSDLQIWDFYGQTQRGKSHLGRYLTNLIAHTCAAVYAFIFIQVPLLFTGFFVCRHTSTDYPCVLRFPVSLEALSVCFRRNPRVLKSPLAFEVTHVVWDHLCVLGQTLRFEIPVCEGNSCVWRLSRVFWEQLPYLESTWQFWDSYLAVKGYSSV